MLESVGACFDAKGESGKDPPVDSELFPGQCGGGSRDKLGIELHLGEANRVPKFVAKFSISFDALHVQIDVAPWNLLSSITLEYGYKGQSIEFLASIVRIAQLQY